MLGFMKESATVWDSLKQTDKPIVLYGMGNGADRILDKCQAEGIPVAGLFASDEFVRGQSFRGYKVHTYQEALSQWGNFVLVIAFASEDPVILKRFFTLAQSHETYAPHVALFANDEIVSPQWLVQHEERLQKIYDSWADDQSRAVMADILNYKISGKLAYLAQVTTRQEDLNNIFSFTKQESYADAGAYNGDTIKEFLELTDGVYQHIYALEPDKKNYQKLKNFVEQEQLRKFTLVNKAIWSQAGSLSFNQKGGRMSFLAETGKETVPAISLDEVVGQAPLTYLKMDVEGAEAKALLGSRNLLQKYGPKLFVAAYHHDADLWRLPELIWAINPAYKLYLRRHPYVPCWEINIFGKVVPEE
jgi:FkbM family methyltransferase